MSTNTAVKRHPMLRWYQGCLFRAGDEFEILNTDATQFGGSGVTVGELTAEPIAWNDLQYSASMTLLPLGVVWLAHRG
jgi:1,4-alpha-glucan branching enzyme